MTGLVLAGGGSRRMGSDKALLDIDGRPLVCRVAERLATMCVAVLVASGGRHLDDLPWTQIDDRAPGAGPFGAILGGLAAASTDLVAVVAVDMPHADAALLRTLADRWTGQAAVVPVVNGRPQPLHAVYAVSALPRLAVLFDGGERSVTRALRLTDAAFHAVAGPDRWARNLNTPDDVTRFDAD